MIATFVLLGGIVVVSIVVLAVWPLGRAIALESVLHPLRRSTIEIHPDGRFKVHPEETTAGREKWQNPNKGDGDHEEEEQAKRPQLAHTGVG